MWRGRGMGVGGVSSSSIADLCCALLDAARAGMPIPAAAAADEDEDDVASGCWCPPIMMPPRPAKL